MNEIHFKPEGDFDDAHGGLNTEKQNFVHFVSPKSPPKLLLLFAVIGRPKSINSCAAAEEHTFDFDYYPHANRPRHYERGE